MSDNKSSQNAHEERIFNDVIQSAFASGGYKKKAATKLCGILCSDEERPDLVIRRGSGSIIGIEHFRIDHHINRGRTASSKSAELMSNLNAQRNRLKPMLNANDNALDEAAEVIANFISKEVYQRHNACCDDLSRSLSVRLFDERSGHALKLSDYRKNLIERYGHVHNIELGYLIEVHSGFHDLFLHNGSKIVRLQEGQCPLYEDLYALLQKASSEVDWILIGFYSCLTDQIVDAAVIDCRNDLFNESCRRQGLYSTTYLGLGKSEPYYIQKREGETTVKQDGDNYTILLENPAEFIDPITLFRNAISEAGRALNLKKAGKPFTTTLSVQMIFELVWMRGSKVPGIVSESDIESLLLEVGPNELYSRLRAFCDRYQISDPSEHARDWINEQSL